MEAPKILTLPSETYRHIPTIESPDGWDQTSSERCFSDASTQCPDMNATSWSVPFAGAGAGAGVSAGAGEGTTKARTAAVTRALIFTDPPSNAAESTARQHPAGREPSEGRRP